MDSIRGQVKGVRLLIDAWFMRRSLILPLLEQQVRIIGQVRRDTALFLPPEPEPKRRGRKRKYGQRVDAAMLDTLPMQAMELMLYGKVQPSPGALGLRRGAIPEGAPGSGGVVRDAPARPHVVAPAPDSGHRDRPVGPTGRRDLRRALGGSSPALSNVV
jgi:hypothetical protein